MGLVARAQSPAPAPAVARVGTAAITAAELDGAVAQYRDAQERGSGQKIPPNQMADFRRSVLEQLIRQRLLKAEAKRQGIAVADSEAMRFLQSQPMFAPGGHFDASRWAAFSADPGRIGAVLADAKELLAAQKLFLRVEKMVTPSASTVDRRLESLTQQAQIRVLAPVPEWFNSGQPLDPDSLRARYRSLATGTTSPARVSLSLAVVPFPDSPSGSDPSAAALRATRARADSLLAAVRGGALFDSIAAALGGLRDAGTWQAGQGTGVFYDDRPLGDEALKTPAGRLLSRPLRLPTGFGLVRVDAAALPRAPSLVQLADSVARSQARADAASRAWARLEGLRAAHPEAFRSVCVDWRGALVDTAGTPEPNPSSGDLQRYYDQHKSEFARLDPEGKGLVYPTLAEARDLIRRRTIEERRGRRMQEKATRIERAWLNGRRDAEAERAARVWDAHSSPGDDPPASATPALLESVLTAPSGRVASFTAPSGIFVYAVSRRDTACVSSRADLDRRALEAAAAQDRQMLEQEAHALYDGHPERYQSGAVYYFSYLVMNPRPWDVNDIPEARIRRYYDTHPDEFGQPAEVRVRHILILVPPRTDSTIAYRRAMEVLSAAKAGASFDSLARIHSQDPATRDQGGDTGWFRKGTTTPAFEDLAFSLEPGQIGGPVRTQFGYHLIQSVEKREAAINPYGIVQGAAGRAVAVQLADSAIRVVADSLAQHVRTSRELHRYGSAHGYPVKFEFWYADAGPMGEVTRNPLVREDVAKMKRPGPLPASVPLAGNYGVVVVDSIGPQRLAEWTTVHTRAVDDALQARRLVGVRAALAAVQREMAAGAPWDSAAAPWGGSLDTAHRPGESVPGVGDPRAVDSLLFGPAAARLAEGHAAVVEGPRGPSLVYLVRRGPSGSAASAADRAALTDLIRERAAYDYFESLKRRFPVRILSADLRRPIAAPPSP